MPIGINKRNNASTILIKCFLRDFTFKDDIELTRPISEKKINKKLIVDKKTSLKDCLSLMVSQKSGAVAICSRKKLVGIFTSGDLKRLVGRRKKRFDLNKEVSNFMSKKPIIIEINETVQKAKELMNQFTIDQLVVMDNGLVMGILDIITGFDLLSSPL